MYTFNVNFNAKFTPDYVTINNKVQTQIISANVKISIYVHDLGFLGLTHVNGRTGVGSGIIIDQVGNDYVVLTNAHVTNIRGRTYMMIDITDYKGVTYTGHKVGYSENLDYDLSMLYFTKKSENLNIV